MASDIKKHEKHLAVVSPDVVKRNLEFFRLKDVIMEMLPIICLSFSAKPPFAEYRKWLHPLYPQSLDDLKNWFGVPNEVAKGLLKESRIICNECKPWSGATQITPKALPQKAGWDFSKLDNKQRLAVRQMSNKLLYGYVSPESQKTASTEGVVNYMLAMAKLKAVQIFVAPDLIICPDEVVEFNNVSALYFNNILIYGNGKLKTKGNTSIHAVQIKRVP